MSPLDFVLKVEQFNYYFRFKLSTQIHYNLQKVLSLPFE